MTSPAATGTHKNWDLRPVSCPLPFCIYPYLLYLGPDGDGLRGEQAFHERSSCQHLSFMMVNVHARPGDFLCTSYVSLVHWRASCQEVRARLAQAWRAMPFAQDQKGSQGQNSYSRIVPGTSLSDSVLLTYFHLVVLIFFYCLVSQNCHSSNN